MPAGTFTEIVFVFLTRPCPSHSLHTCCTVSPRPPHMEHGCDFASVPNGVRYRCSILPLPGHVSHDFSPLPPRPSHFSQRSIRVILTFLAHPKHDSMKSISSSYFISRPFRCPDRFPPKSKILSKMSEKSPWKP